MVKKLGGCITSLVATPHTVFTSSKGVGDKDAGRPHPRGEGLLTSGRSLGLH